MESTCLAIFQQNPCRRDVRHLFLLLSLAPFLIFLLGSSSSLFALTSYVFLILSGLWFAKFSKTSSLPLQTISISFVIIPTRPPN